MELLCGNLNVGGFMDDKELETIPYVVYKVLEAKYEKLIKKLTLALIGTNLFYLLFFVLERLI